MSSIFKKAVHMSLGLTLVVFAAQAAKAGTNPCPTCGGGARPTTPGVPNTRPTLQFPLPNGGSFTLPGRVAPTAFSAPAGAVAAPSSPASVTPTTRPNVTGRSAGVTSFRVRTAR